MKKFLQFSGLISCAVALVGFVLLLACHGVVGADNPAANWYSSGAVLFGKGPAQATLIVTVSGTFEGKASGAALVSWIFSLVALLALVCGAVLTLLKAKKFAKVAGLANLCAALLLLVAGICLFFALPSFAGNNQWNNTNGWAISGGWVVASILYIIAGAIAVCPAVVDFVSKK